VITITAELPMRVLHPQPTREKGVMASISKLNHWDDTEADKADKEDQRALLSALVAIIAIWAAALVLT
jgi:hypothetical protein